MALNHPSQHAIFVGANILYYDCPRASLRLSSPRCFVGYVYDIIYSEQKVGFVTYEHNENSSDSFYCRHSCSFADLDRLRQIYPIDVGLARKYALEHVDAFNKQKQKESQQKQQTFRRRHANEDNAFVGDLEALETIFISSETMKEQLAPLVGRRRTLLEWQMVTNEAIIEYFSQHETFPDVLPAIYTISSTRDISYGDGGRDTLKYPIWISDHLDVEKAHYNVIKTELKKIGNENGDYRENEPIQNVIDPDLYALRLDRNKFVDEYTARFENAYNYLRDGGVADEFKAAADKKWFIRGHYQWLPTVFTELHRNDELKQSQIKILSPIHNIGADKKYKKLYSSIAHVFQCMLPMFNKFEKFRNRKKDKFQVIVKSQRYAIEPRKGYSGMWHTEGLTENIAFVGLYYWEWNKGLSGGNMKFRPKHLPEFFYGNEEWSTFEVECGESAKHKAMVWDNEYFVHRVRMLKNINKDKKIRKKGYLAFFVIDPENELENTTQTIQSLKKEEYINTLYQRVFLKHYKMPQMNMNICAIIVEYSGNGITLEEAKKRRKETIAVKKHTKSKWGEIQFGNCGEIFYFPMGAAVKGNVEWDEWYKKYRIRQAPDRFLPTTESNPWEPE